MNLSNFLIINFLIFLYGCGSLQKYDHKKYYKKNLLVNINGRDMVGVGTVPFAESYEIVINNHKKIDFLSIQSCARSIDIEEPYFKKRIIKNYKEYRFTYKPMDYERDCSLEFIVADKNQEHTVSTLSFELKDSKVSALIDCNGLESWANDEFLCQSKAGLIQRINFNQEVTASKGCGFLIRKGSVFKIALSPGESQCVFINNKGEFFVFRGYGWNSIMLLKE